MVYNTCQYKTERQTEYKTAAAAEVNTCDEMDTYSTLTDKMCMCVQIPFPRADLRWREKRRERINGNMDGGSV